MKYLGAILLMFTPLLSTFAQEKKLNIFIWSEYLPGEVVSAFEKKHGCKVVVDLYEEAESMMAKVQAGGASIYDIVVPPDYLVPVMTKLQLLAPLRHENIPNLNNLEPKFLNPPYDPGNKYSVAYQWGTVGIYARKTEGKPVVDSWAQYFSPGQAGKISMIDSPRDLIGAALKARGHSVNSIQTGQLKEARELIVEAKKRSIGFAGSVGGKNQVLSRAVSMAIVYSGEAARGMAEDPDTYYVIPKEGGQIWVDNLAILAKAPHRELAEKFLNFVLEAEVGAQISNFTQFSTPNAAAKKHIEPALLKNEAVYPPVATMQKLEFLKDLGRETRLYDQLWTQIKSR